MTIARVRSKLLVGAAAAGLCVLHACERSPREPAPAADLPTAIRTIVRERMGSLKGLPGAVVGIRIGDDFEFREAFGFMEQEHTTPMRIDCSFPVASVAKPFLGNVALKLADEGVIRLDAPINTYLKDVPHGDVVTVRMLGQNTSGYFNAVADPAFRRVIDADPARLWKAPEILAYAMDKELTLAVPGKGWSYSNTNSVLLGQVIAAVTGEHWSVALDRLIASPLGLRSLAVEEGDAPGVARAVEQHRAEPRGYRYSAKDSAMMYGSELIDATDFSPSWAGAAGSMHASLDDLLRSCERVLSGSMLSPEMRATFHGWIDTGFLSEAGDYSEPETIYYGFNIGKRRIGGGDYVGHPGDVPGYSSYIAYRQDTRMCIVVLCNLSNSPGRLVPAEEIAEAVMSILPQSAPGTPVP